MDNLFNKIYNENCIEGKKMKENMNKKEIKSLGSPERADLFEYMVNEKIPYGPEEYGWCAGQQLKALDFYTNKKFDKLDCFKEDNWQGNCFAIILLKDKGIFVIWRDYFGSCSGCDGLENQNGYEYIKSTLSEGNTLQFLSIADAKKYVKDEKKSDRWGEWGEMPLIMFDNALEKLKKIIASNNKKVLEKNVY